MIEINKCARFTIDTINAGNGTLSVVCMVSRVSDKVAVVQTENQRGSCMYMCWCAHTHTHAGGASLISCLPLD